MGSCSRQAVQRRASSSALSVRSLRLAPVLLDATGRVGPAHEPSPLRPRPYAAKQFDRARGGRGSALNPGDASRLRHNLPGRLASGDRVGHSLDGRAREVASDSVSNQRDDVSRYAALVVINRGCALGLTKPRQHQARARCLEILRA